MENRRGSALTSGLRPTFVVCLRTCANLEPILRALLPPPATSRAEPQCGGSPPRRQKGAARSFVRKTGVGAPEQAGSGHVERRELVDSPLALSTAGGSMGRCASASFDGGVPLPLTQTQLASRR